MLRERVVRFGCRGEGASAGISERDGGMLGWFSEGRVGRVCRKEVRRWELWIWRGSSRRMSW